MKQVMPQEVEVWYLLPALRRELTKIMIEEHGLSQKQVAKYLGVSEPAISQYQKSKRAGEIKFSKSDTEKIKKSARKMINDPDHMMKELYALSKQFRGNETICKIHKQKCNHLPDDCDICMK